jgi:hypothetical protein
VGYHRMHFIQQWDLLTAWNAADVIGTTALHVCHSLPHVDRRHFIRCNRERDKMWDKADVSALEYNGQNTGTALAISAYICRSAE